MIRNICPHYQNEESENGHLMIQKCVLPILDSRHMYISEWSFQTDSFSLWLTGSSLRKCCHNIKSWMAHSEPPVFSGSPHKVASTLEYTSGYYQQHILPSIALQCTTKDSLLGLHQDQSEQENALRMIRGLKNELLIMNLSQGEISHVHATGCMIWKVSWWPPARTKLLGSLPFWRPHCRSLVNAVDGTENQPEEVKGKKRWTAFSVCWRKGEFLELQDFVRRQYSLRVLPDKHLKAATSLSLGESVWTTEKTGSGCDVIKWEQVNLRQGQQVRASSGWPHRWHDPQQKTFCVCFTWVKGKLHLL